MENLTPEHQTSHPQSVSEHRCGEWVTKHVTTL